jgi:hypothetical protein
MTYKGEWKNGKRHGWGTLLYPDGSQYRGEWSNDRFNGTGTKEYVNSKIYKYVGEWKNGDKYGWGTEVYSTGSQYTGEWKEGKMHGKGILTTMYGRKYNYKWKSTYDGEWANGKMHGRGIMTFDDGSTFRGTWVRNRKHGIGTMIYPDGTKVKEKWVNGRLPNSPDFYLYEFESVYTVKELCSVITSDINFSLEARDNTIQWLNELLAVPDLYEKLYKKGNNSTFPSEILALIKDTRKSRRRKFSDLNVAAQDNIKKLNRLLIEYRYPRETPKHDFEG